MTDLDLERLGDVWRQRPDPQELEELRRTAERVRRRARWVQVVDVLAAIIVAGVVLAMVLANPEVDTLLVGGGAILVLLVGQIRSRRFRQQELRSLSGSAEQMLDQSIERVQASVKRARSGLIIYVPGLLLGYLVAFVAERRSGRAVSEAIAANPELRSVMQILAAVAIVGGFLFILRSMQRARRELHRLTALRDSYHEEHESHGAD